MPLYTKKSSSTTNPDSVLESNLALYNAKWNLPKAADHCGMTKREMKMRQSMKDRRDESKAMSKKMYGHSYGADKGMSYRHTSSWKTHDHLK